MSPTKDIAMGLTSSLNRQRLIGSEFEGYIILTGEGDGRSAQKSLADALTANGIQAIARGYDHSPLPNGVQVAVEYDSSIVPEQRYAGIRWAQLEVKTKPLTLDEWETVVPPTLELLRYAGMRVNATTGHHIHLSFEEMESDKSHVRSLWNLYHRHQSVLYGLVAPSRRQNTYCRAMPSATKLLHGANSMRELRRRLNVYDRFCFFQHNAPAVGVTTNRDSLASGNARPRQGTGMDAPAHGDDGSRDSSVLPGCTRVNPQLA